jgi:hypothetical protein
VLLQDAIRSGSYSTFGGYAQFHNLIWIMLPVLLTFYICVLLVLVGYKHLLKYHCLTITATSVTGINSDSSSGLDPSASASASGSGSGSGFDPAAVPSSTPSDMPHDCSNHTMDNCRENRVCSRACVGCSKHEVCIKLLKAMWTTTTVLLVLGIMLMVLNLTAAAFQDNSFTICSPLLHASAACISRNPSSLYQYLWVLLSTGVLTAASFMAYRVALSDTSARAKRVYEILRSFMQAHNGQGIAVATWKANIWPQSARVGARVRWYRRCSFYALHLPLLALASIPDFLYGNC